MTGASEVVLVLREVPPTGLAASGALATAGAVSACSAAADAARAAGKAVRRVVRKQEDFDRQFLVIIGADPELQAAAREGRQAARDSKRANGGPGLASRIARRLGAGLLRALDLWVGNEKQDGGRR